MECFTQRDIKTMFSGLCCAKCKNDFDINSIEVVENRGDIFHCKLTCEKCGMNYGDIILNYDRKSKKHSELQALDGPPPITADDVLDAHIFIKKMK